MEDTPDHYFESIKALAIAGQRMLMNRVPPELVAMNLRNAQEIFAVIEEGCDCAIQANRTVALHTEVAKRISQENS